MTTLPGSRNSTDCSQESVVFKIIRKGVEYGLSSVFPFIFDFYELLHLLPCLKYRG